MHEHIEIMTMKEIREILNKVNKFSLTAPLKKNLNANLSACISTTFKYSSLV